MPDTLPGWPAAVIPREALLPIRDVMRLTSLPQSTIYERIAAGQFPRACKLGGRRVAWPADEVLDWCEARRQEREAA